MSITLKILIPAVPPANDDAYAFANAMAQACTDEAPVARLVQFHDALIARYPCWSSGAYAGAGGRAACPWTDSPLINCFRGDMGILGIDTADAAVVPFVLRRAGAFALTVIDEVNGKVYRPATFSVVFSGVQKNVNIDAMVSKLMPLLKASRAEVMAALGTPHVMLKCRLDYVTATRFAATMDLIGCNCTIEKEVLVPVGGNLTANTFAASQAGANVMPPAALRVEEAPMGRFQVDEPDARSGRVLRGGPSWFARVLGRGDPSRR